MAVSVAPVFNQQFFDDNGDPLALGSLTFQQGGTSTPLVAYKTAALDPGNVWAAPLVLDAAGRVPSPHTIYFAANSTIKVLVKDSTDVQLYSVDLVPPVAAAAV